MPTDTATRRSGRGAAWGLLGAFCLLGGPARADLDAEVPPDPPFEWEHPTRRPTQSLAVPRVAAPSLGRTRERGPSTRARPAGGATTAMGSARVTTVDLLPELGWPDGPSPEDLEPPHDGRSVTGGPRGEETLAPYPPPVGHELYWLAFAIVLRHAFHPNRASELESLERLVELGAAGLAVVSDVARSPLGRGQRGVRAPEAWPALLERWHAALGERVGALPPSHPRAVGDDDPHRRLLLRVTADDLAAGYAHALASRFGERVLSLPAGEAIGLLAAYTDRGVHPLLRRNAVALLGAYDHPTATQALLDAGVEDRDPVVRVRALLALARRSAAAAALAEAVGRDVEPAAVWALGLLRSKDAVRPARKLLREDEPDAWLLAVRALGRAGAGDGPAERSLERLGGRLDDLDPAALHLPAALPSSWPDGEAERHTVLAQLTLLALARTGAEDPRERVLDLLDADPPMAGIGEFGRQPLAAAGTFGAFLPPTWGYVVETLAELGADGEAGLEAIARDRVCERSHRLAALRAIAELDAADAALFGDLRRGADAAVRAEALHGLAAFAPAEAEAAARAALARADGPELIAAAEVVVEAARPAGPERVALLRGGPLRLAPEAGGLTLARLDRGDEVDVEARHDDWVRVAAEVDGELVEGWLPASVLPAPEPGPGAQLVGALERVREARAAAAERARGGRRDPRRRARGFAANPTIEVELPVLEALAGALGRLGTPEARTALVALLEDDDQRPAARAAAATALAAGDPRPLALEALVRTLKDDAGWVRYAAWRALDRAAGADDVEDGFCDWVYGGPGDRAPTVAAWRRWLKGGD